MTDQNTSNQNPQDQTAQDQNTEQTGQTSTSESSKAENETETLKQEILELREMAKKLAAEMHNQRQRHLNERELMLRRANISMIKSLIPAIDNLDRALSHTPETATEWAKGINMSINEIHKTLQQQGLSTIEKTAVEFNPDQHEAITQGPGEINKVLEIYEKGYIIDDQVIRPAKVKVGNGESN